MVMNIMSNERRWGDLEARKTIVIDYVEHKSKKNEHDRVSAYEEDHHEPIVSREIALAAQMVKKSSRKMTEGVPDFSVIHKRKFKRFCFYLSRLGRNRWQCFTGDLPGSI